MLVVLRPVIVPPASVLPDQAPPPRPIILPFHLSGRRYTTPMLEPRTGEIVAATSQNAGAEIEASAGWNVLETILVCWNEAFFNASQVASAANTLPPPSIRSEPTIAGGAF